eukprot:89108-Amphidinium_carterae.1
MMACCAAQLKTNVGATVPVAPTSLTMRIELHVCSETHISQASTLRNGRASQEKDAEGLD